MKVVIMGANGFVGSSLIKRMIREKIEVLAIDISFAVPRLPQSKYIKTLELDLQNVEDVEKEIDFGEYDIFYNLAWKGVNGPEKAKYDIQLSNILLTLKYAEIAKKYGCKKYLCAGTIAERAVESLSRLTTTNGGMMYGVAKSCDRIMLENYCKNIGLDFVWMQFSNIYGAENTTGNLISYTLGQLFKGEEAIFGPANQPYDFIYIDDLIEAIYRLGICKTKRNFYFIGSGNPQILSDYLKEVGSAFGRPDLIKIGLRDDDGIRYTYDMMQINDLVEDIGIYNSGTFDALIRQTIERIRGFEDGTEI